MAPIDINNQNIDSVTVNGTEVQEITANGDLVFSSGPPTGSWSGSPIHVGDADGSDRIYELNYSNLSGTGSSILGFNWQNSDGDGNGFTYFTDVDDDRVVKIDISTFNIADAKNLSPEGGVAVVVGADGYVYVSDRDSNIYTFDANFNEQNSVNLNTSFSGWFGEKMTWGGDGHLWHGDRSSELVHRINPNTFSFETYNTGHEVMGITYGLNGKLYYNGPDGAAKADPENPGSLEATQPAASGSGADITYHPNGFVYAGNGSGVLLKLDPSDLSIVDSASPASDNTLEVQATEDYVYYCTRSSGIYRINPSDMSTDAFNAGTFNKAATVAGNTPKYILNGNDVTL